MSSSQTGTKEFQFLAILVLEKEAADAKIIPTNKVVFEDRVVLKCKVGYNHYKKP
jgi:predicted metal-binding protein